MYKFLILFFILTKLVACDSGKEVVLDYVDGDLLMGKGTGLVKPFYEHVFKDQADRPRIAIYSHWDELPPDNFKGVHIFLDGESSGPSEKHRKYLDRMLYLGPLSNTGAKASIYLPFASLHFAERKLASPLALLEAAPTHEKKYFAAYLAYKCVDFREKLYDRLVRLAQKHNLGEVHALSKCHGQHPETLYKKDENKNRTHTHYLDSAVDIYKDYEFVLSSENAIIDGYVTEKPIHALLAGAIPIYIGSKAITDRGILNPESFLFIDEKNSFASFEKQILELAKDSDKKYAMLNAAPLVNDTHLYVYSWHKGTADRLKKAKTETLRALIKATVQNMSSPQG